MGFEYVIIPETEFKNNDEIRAAYVDLAHHPLDIFPFLNMPYMYRLYNLVNPARDLQVTLLMGAP